jgi:hypothetical protein
MSNDDPLIAAANLRGKQLYASRKQAEAYLARYVADGDQDMIADTLGDIAAIDAQGEALNRLHQQHTQRAPAPVPDDSNEFLAKPAHKMGGDDALRIINYGKREGDPTRLTADDYNRQLGALHQAKARGMYKD